MDNVMRDLFKDAGPKVGEFILVRAQNRVPVQTGFLFSSLGYSLDNPSYTVSIGSTDPKSSDVEFGFFDINAAWWEEQFSMIPENEGPEDAFIPVENWSRKVRRLAAGGSRFEETIPFLRPAWHEFTPIEAKRLGGTL